VEKIKVLVWVVTGDFTLLVETLKEIVSVDEFVKLGGNRLDF
jgi:phosphoserine phosphatase